MNRPLASSYRRVYEALNYRLRTFSGGAWASRCRPTTIAILLTELCNARCVHCDIWKNRGKEDSPTAEQWKEFLRDLRRWLGPVQVTMTGGEALLRPYAVDLVAWGSSLGLFMEHLTHGYWDDQKKIEALGLANPWRITISLDGLKETHTRIRGREGFFEKSTTTLETLRRVRKDRSLDYAIRLKTVIMHHNLDDVCELARFAKKSEAEIFYQPIEQNYNTPEDPSWFEHSENWPRDTAKAVSAVQALIALKREGFPIANSIDQLDVMIPYFQHPDAMRVRTQAHTAHDRKALCAALTMLQLQANGDVTVCSGIGPVGNIKNKPIRQIWEERPKVWETGCCLEWRCTPAEKKVLQEKSG